ncbi:MAG: autotransporter-associated beta strand repeat-containing protein [Luteolibacter sp.]|uniref:autotransporter-associated beta strand repeat-containing protein n=1 Tax=Luteolibacter sp. TaxID=1962973 RepID=UPI003267A1CD
MKSNSRNVLLSALLFTQAHAATIYWDGANGSWLNSAAWSTDSAATTPDPVAAPVVTDDAIFNITTANAATTVTFNANHAANSLTFNNTGTTTLAADGTNRALGVGAGGMTMASGAGTATIGSATANQNIPVTFTGTQTWVNNSSNKIVLANNFTASGGITKQGTGDVWMSDQANNTAVAGLLDIQAGKIQVSGDFTLNGGLTGAGSLENGGPNSKWVFIQSAGDFNFGGTITGSATARLGLVKRNNTGTLTLSGNNVIGDRLSVERGVIKITGTTVAGVSGTANNAVAVGNGGSVNSTMLIEGGTLTCYKNSSPTIAISSTANSAGLLKMTSGTITTASEFHIGRGNAVYGAYTQTGGSLTVGSWLAVGLAGDSGILNQSGGSITVAANRMTIGAGGAASFGIVNLSGGTFTDNTGIFVGENGTGTLNISGSHSMTLGTGGTAQFAGNATSLAGTINLLGGTLSANSVTKGTSSATGVYRFHFNGGTLKANANNTAFFNDLALTDAYVYSGGGTVDNNSFNITLTEALKAPSGNGVSATGLVVGGGGYLETPRVNITGGSGTGASAVANIDASGNLTSITMTSAGIGYLTAPTFTLVGGGFGNTGTLTGAATLVANTSGAMTFSGSGTTTIKTAFTYAGGTTLTGGKLDLNATFAASAGPMTLANGTSLSVTPPVKGNTINFTNLTFGSTAATTYFANVGDLAGANPATAPVNVTGTLAVNGPVTINVTGTKFQAANLKLLTYASKTGSGSFVLGTLPVGVVANLVDDNAGNVYLNITSVALPRWNGTVDGVWDIATTANWVDQVLLTGSTYLNPNPVLFNDLATGTGNVTLGVTVLPQEVQFNNAAKAYTLTGLGKISGASTLIKKGTGTASITAMTNDYTGVTRLEGGTLTVDVLTDGGVAGPLGAATSAPSNLVLAGGVLAYTGASTTINRGFMIDGTNSGLNITNNLTVTGGITSGLLGGMVKTGAGTLSITNAGTNTIGAAANGLFITAGKVIFDGTAGAQINNVAAEMWVSNTPDVSADLTVTNSTLNLVSWLALARGNGNTGICNLNLTNSTVNVGNFSCGFNNALANNSSQTFITQTNSTFTNTGTTHVAESTSSQGTWILQSGSVYNAGNTFNIGGAGTAVGTVTVKDTSSIVKGAAGTMVIGNAGNGILNLENSSSLTVGAIDTYIGNAGLTTTGNLNVKDTATANFGGTVFVGKSDAAGTGTSYGALTQTGGTVNAATWLVVGRYVGAQGVYNLSAGTVNQTAVANTASTMTIAEGGVGVLNISGSGTINVSGPLLSIAKLSTAVGTVNLNGGTLNAKRVVEEAGGGSSTLNMNGGVLKATADSAAFIAVDTANVQAGGAVIDSNGFTLATAQPLAGAGGLTKQGAGSLTLTGSLDYVGTTTVNGGTLALGPFISLPTGNNLTVNAGTFDLRNGNGDRAAAVSALTLNGATLLVGANSISTDSISAATVSATGTTTIKLSGVLDPGTYDIITSGAALSGTFSLDTSAIVAGFTTYVGNVVGNKYVVTVTGSATPTEAYWKGDVSSIWNDATNAPNNSNWATTSGGATDTKQIPGLVSDVYFQAAGATNTDTTLGVNFTVNSLTFSSGTSTLGGANTLTLQGYNPNFKSLEVQPGATANIALANMVYTGDALIDTGAVLSVSGGSLGNTTSGAVQVDGTLNVNSIFGKAELSGTGTVSRSVPGTGVLTIGGGGDSVFSGTIQNGTGTVRLGKTGINKLSLTGSNTFSGGISLSGGTLELGSTTAAGTGTLTLSGGTLDNTTGSALNVTNPVSLGGAWAFAGSNDITLSGAKTSFSQPTVTVMAGTLTIPDSITGSFGLVKNGPGTLNLAGTVTSAATNAAGVISLASGVTNFTGTLQSTGAEIWLLNGAGNNGTVNMTTGAINATNWLAIGRDSASGVFNMSGGSVTKTTANGNITTSGVGGTQTTEINQSGGLITNTDSQTWIAEHGIATYNLSGSATTNLGIINLGSQNVATSNGTVNLDGGTLTVKQIIKGGAAATGTFNFNGGTLVANTGATAATFLTGLSASNVRNGGALINSNGQDITIGQVLQHSAIGADAATDGGLTKTGAGKLILAGVNTYTGNTTVTTGMLSLSNACLSDTSTVNIAGGATLELTHGATDNVTGLVINGVTKANGIYGAISSGAQFETAAIIGNGKLQVGANAYETWADLKGLTGADRLDSADPDKDGRNNLAEFAFDGNPLSGASDGKLVGKIGTVGGNNVLTLTVPVRTGAVFSDDGTTHEEVSALIDGVIYRIQGADELATWTNNVTEVTGTDATTIQAGLPSLSTGWTYRTFRVPGSVFGKPTDFIRAKVNN